jgi:dihydrofolate synthase/folylpolyglutamate synthase
MTLNMNDEFQGDLKDFIDYFSKKNYEKSRRFNQSFTYDPNPLKLFLDELGNPQKDYRAIHVAGTTGKGSAATLMARALGGTSQTGLYVSPHLENLYERISIQHNNTAKNISNEDFLQLWNSVKKIKLVKDISFFDALTAIAMLYFKAQNVKWAVFETGLGGKLDSTNNLAPDFCILTPIGLDHQNILGDTIEKIAKEKAGIIKAQTPVYAFVENPEARSCIDKICREKKSETRYYQADENLNFIEKNHSFVKWVYEDFFKTNMPNIDHKIKGRVEVLCNKPNIVFDSAHNMMSFQELFFWVVRESGKWRIYVNTMKERNISEIIEFIDSQKNENLQFEIFLFPIDEAGYYRESDFNEESSIKIINHDVLCEKLNNDQYRHLICGSMRLYPKLKNMIVYLAENT